MKYACASITKYKQEKEIVRYNKMNLTGIASNRQDFQNISFSAVKFWYQWKESFQKIFPVALRVYAAVVGSCTSERVFSVVNNVMTNDINFLSSSNVENIILTRSLCPN